MNPIHLLGKNPVFTLFVSTFVFIFRLSASLGARAVEPQIIASNGTKNVRAELVPQYKAIQTAKNRNIEENSIFSIGVRFQLRPKWHIYWENPGDSGIKTEIEWEVPRSIRVKETVWPSPKRLYAEPLMTYGYENEVFALSSFNASGISDVSTKIKAKIKWLECREICLPGKANLEIELPYSSESSPQSPFFETMLKKYRNDYPQKKKLEARAEYDQDHLKLSVTGLYTENPKNPVSAENSVKPFAYFFIDKPGIIQHIPEQPLELKGGTMTFSLPLDINHDLKEKSISGYLRLVSSPKPNQSGESITYEIQADIKQSYVFSLSFVFVALLALLWYRYKSKLVQN